MRVNVYAEEMTERIGIIEKEVDGGHRFTGLRFYMGDGNSAVTFWGKRDLREALRRALAVLDEHYHATSLICGYDFNHGQRCGALATHRYGLRLLCDDHAESIRQTMDKVEPLE